MPVPVVLLESGGVPAVRATSGIPATPVGPKIGGMPITLVQDGGFPIALSEEESPYKFITSRASRMMTVQNSAVVSGTVYHCVRLAFMSPPYDVTNPRICIPNFYVKQSGETTPETLSGNALVIEGSSIRLKSGDTTRYQFTYGGSTGATLSATTPYIWSDPQPDITIPANSIFYVYHATQVATDGFRVAGYRPFNNYTGSNAGDRYTYGSTTQSGFLTTGEPGTPTTGVYMHGPCAIIGQGWLAAGKPPVPLVVGDSIGFGQGEDTRSSDTTNGNYGYINRGLADAAGSTKYAFANFCVPGTRLTNLSNTINEFKYRYQLLSDVGFPFTCILTQMGVNSVGTYSTMLTQAQASFNFLHTLGGKKIIQCGLSPKTSQTSNTRWSTVAGQTTAADDTAVTGSRWQFNAWLEALSDWRIGTFIDATSYFVDGTSVDKWRATGRSGTLQADVSSGTSISLDFAPNVGDKLVIDVDTAGYEEIECTAVSGAGPYTVTLRTAIQSAHTTGDLVRVTSSTDGIHPETNAHIYAADAIIAAKVAGVFV